MFKKIWCCKSRVHDQHNKQRKQWVEDHKQPSCCNNSESSLCDTSCPNKLQPQIIPSANQSSFTIKIGPWEYEVCLNPRIIEKQVQQTCCLLNSSSIQNQNQNLNLNQNQNQNQNQNLKQNQNQNNIFQNSWIKDAHDKSS